LTTAPLEAPASPPFSFEAVRAPRWFGFVAIAAFALLPIVGYLGNEGEAAVIAAAGLAALPLTLRRRLPPVGLLLLIALTAWAVASFRWSPLLPLQAHPHGYKQLEALTAPKLVLQLLVYSAFVSGALRLAAEQRRQALQWIAWALAGVTVVLVVDAAVQGGVYDLFNRLFGKHDLSPDLARRDAARGCYTVALFFWPVALFSLRRTNVGVPILIALATALSSVALGEDAPAAALLFSALVWAAVRVNARAGAWACMAGSVVYFLVAPLVFLSRQPNPTPGLAPAIGKASWQARLDIWTFASHLIARRPVIGYGLDASRAFEPRIPMHPHDAALQLWLELGVPGALLAALFFGWIFYKVARVARTDASWAAVACATGSVYLLIGAVSFGVWQEWWLAAGAAALAACGMLQQQRRDVGANASEAQELKPL
jgi:O-antigen ligase